MPPRKSTSLQGNAPVLLLNGLLLLAVVGFAFFVAWRYGLLARVWSADRTGISVAITLVFLAAAAHGSVCLVRLSRSLHHLADLQRHAAADGGVGKGALPEGCVSRYIRDLQTKARAGLRTIDQGPLLETFEAELRQGHLFGRFVADLLLSLGLLGTVVGLIVMLGPIGGLDALAAISGGMAVALYTSLAGLIGGILLKAQGRLLDGGVALLVRRIARLTEADVQGTPERMKGDANV